MREYIRRIESLLLSLRQVLSIYFRIVLVVIIRIPSLKLVVLRNYRTLGNVRHLVIEYVILSLKYSKIYRSRVYPSLVEGLTDIKLYKYLSSIYLSQCLIK
jgi:hypothetical protein